MTLDLFLRGLAIGFAVAFALGPIGLLVIRRTLERGWSFGFLSGLGVATADATYGAIAAFGLTAISELLVGIDQLLGLVGGIVLVLMAARALRASLAASPDEAPAARAETSRLERPAAAYASMVGLTMTNPATILSFAALRTRLTPRVVRWLNIAAALIIGAFGIVAIAIGLGLLG